jgi:hypothetical protein
MVKLTAAATKSIPRIIIFALTLVYGFAGLFFRDPWKNEDAIGFGGMWTLFRGNSIDWIVPHLAGRDISLGTPLPLLVPLMPLVYTLLFASSLPLSQFGMPLIY